MNFFFIQGTVEYLSLKLDGNCRQFTNFSFFKKNLNFNTFFVLEQGKSNKVRIEDHDINLFF